MTRLRYLLGLLLGVCVFALSVACTPASAASTPRPTLVITYSVARALAATDAGAALDNPKTIVLAYSGKEPPGLTVATLARSYKNVSRFRADLAGSWPASVRVVVYDPEAWSATPLGQQRRPGLYEHRFVRLAHAHHLRVILAPARTLTRVIRSCPALSASVTMETRYIACHVSRGAARAFHGTGMAGTFDAPTQRDELDRPAFLSLFRRAAAQARAEHPRIRVLAGISTGLVQGYASGEQLAKAARLLGSSVDGFWIGANAADSRSITSIETFLLLYSVTS